MDMIKLGVNSVLFQGHDLATAMKHIAWAGYDGIELSAISGMCEHLEIASWRTQADMIKSLAAEHKLALLSMEVASLDEDRLTMAFEAGQAIGIPVINVGPGGKSDVEDDFVRQTDLIVKMAEKAAKYGVTLCCKAHVGGSIYNTPTTLRAIKKITAPAFGVDMDPSHIYRANENPVEAIAAVISRVKHVHIRDCKGRQQGPGKPEMQANGRGDIDLLGYIRVLHQNGYTGPLDLEVIGAKDYSVPACCIIAAETRGHMQACLQACGAR
jgi:sugar phosphate isomerase/epimerase